MDRRGRWACAKQGPVFLPFPDRLMDRLTSVSGHGRGPVWDCWI